MTHLSNTISLKVVAVGGEGFGFTPLFTEGPVELFSFMLGLCDTKSLLTLLSVNRYSRSIGINFFNRNLKRTGLLEAREEVPYTLKEMAPLISSFYRNGEVPFKLYAEIIEEASVRLLYREVEIRQTLLKAMVTMEFYTRKNVNDVLRVVEQFPANKEDLLTALEYCEPRLRRSILAYFSVMTVPETILTVLEYCEPRQLRIILDYYSNMTVPEPGEDGLYSFVIDGKNYTLGIKDPGPEQKIGIFLDNRLLSGKVVFTPNDANDFKTSIEGEWSENGHFIKGRVTYQPNADNDFKTSIEGDFDGNGVFKGKKEYYPNAENGFILSQVGLFEDVFRIGFQIRKGVEVYSKRTCNNLGVLNWTIGRFGRYPSALNCFSSEEDN